MTQSRASNLDATGAIRITSVLNNRALLCAGFAGNRALPALLGRGAKLAGISGYWVGHSRESFAVELCRTGSRASCPASGDLPRGGPACEKLQLEPKRLMPTPLIGVSSKRRAGRRCGRGASAFLPDFAASRNCPSNPLCRILPVILPSLIFLFCGTKKATLGERTVALRTRHDASGSVAARVGGTYGQRGGSHPLRRSGAKVRL